MKQYHDLMKTILEDGIYSTDRTNTGTKSVFGHQMRFDLSKGFPLLTTKKLYTKAIIHELLWFLSGNTNIKYLNENNVHIWDEWANENGDLGPVYAAQWRRWAKKDGSSVDQIQRLIDTIKSTPDSRRLIVNSWNVGELDEMALTPCHALFQFRVLGNKLHCQLYQRSADVFLGVPFNIASYALLTHMVAQQTGYEVGDFVWTGGDCHLYVNHFEQAELQLSRDEFPLPSLEIIRKPESIFDYKYEDFKINGYEAHPSIKAPIAV